MIITFIGHGSLDIDTALSNKIKETIKNNIDQERSVVFYCGGYGAFDLHCAEICRQLKPKIPNCEIVFITPYITSSQQEKMKYYLESDLYDSVIYPPLENIPLRFAISKRNEWMISESDIVIAYVLHSFGGAYKSLEYARRKKKKIFNLAE